MGVWIRCFVARQFAAPALAVDPNTLFLFLREAAEKLATPGDEGRT